MLPHTRKQGVANECGKITWKSVGGRSSTCWYFPLDAQRKQTAMRAASSVDWAAPRTGTSVSSIRLPGGRMQKFTGRSALVRGDRRGLLDRILDTPQLAKVVPRLTPELLHRVIERCGSRTAASSSPWRRRRRSHTSSISICGGARTRASTSSSTRIGSACGSRCWWSRAPTWRRGPSPGSTPISSRPVSRSTSASSTSPRWTATSPLTARRSRR